MFAVIFAAFGLSLSCTELGGKSKTNQGAGNHQKMLPILAELQKKYYNPKNAYCSEAKLADCNAQLAAAQTHEQQMQIAFRKAMILLEFGDEAQAVALFEQLYQLVINLPEPRKGILIELGMAYMHLGQ